MVVLPASGCEIIANVLRLETSPINGVFDMKLVFFSVWMLV